jgi:hypothetical protein
MPRADVGYRPRRDRVLEGKIGHQLPIDGFNPCYARIRDARKLA